MLDIFKSSRFLNQLFQVSIALWFFRMILPGMKYLFIPGFILLLFVLVAFHRRSIFVKQYFYEFLKTFTPLLLLGVFFFIALLNSDKLYSRSLKDLFEFGINLVFLAVFFALTYQSSRDLGFMSIYRKITRIIWVSAVVVAVLGFVKFYLQSQEVAFPINTPFGTAFNNDKNFYALYAVLGMIALIPRLANAKTTGQKLFSQLLFILLLVNIIFSYSYRSILLIAIVLLALIILQLIYYFKKDDSYFFLLAKNLRNFTILLLLGFLTFVLFFFKEPQLSESVALNYYKHVDSGLSLSGNAEELFDRAFHFDKWRYAIALLQERNFTEAVFGKGFSYLSVFGMKFMGSNSLEDYPHNPILSALLYSGYVGAIFAFLFLLIAIYYAFKYLTVYPLFSLMLLTSMFFVTFSGNSLFSVPLFLFLFSLSFMVRHVEISELHIDMNIHKPGSKFFKEVFDYILASLALVLLSPLLVIVSLIILFTMGWPIVFSQVRIGQNGKEFRLHKFRSMKKVNSSTTIAASEQFRITKFGSFIRKYKIDELPELWNIIRGDMSFVGPRPDVPGYMDNLKESDKIILQLRPGLTGAASLKYMHEEELLAKQDDPQSYNDEVIFPDKVLVNKKYMEKWSLYLDLKIIVMTGLGISMHEDSFP